MGQCDYWLGTDTDCWCEMMSASCSCGGSEDLCRLGGKTISEVIKEEEETTLQEIAYRERRRRASEHRAG